MRSVLKHAALVVILLLALPGRAVASETEIRAAIDAWYAEVRKGEAGRPSSMLAPGGVIEPRLCPDRCGPQPRALKFDPGGAYRHLLAARAQLFRPEIEKLVVEGSLAKADVWERGYFYARAAGQTYENAAGATFVFERREGQPWKILLYTSRSSAVRPGDRGQPMPDLSPRP